jgi:hypothetical protein
MMLAAESCLPLTSEILNSLTVNSNAGDIFGKAFFPCPLDEDHKSLAH